jgi:hypothetical protein
MHEGTVVPTLLYSSEVWATSAEDRKSMGVMEKKCMRAMCGLSVMDRVRNEEVRRSCGNELNIGVQMNRNVLMCYGHVERTEEDRVELDGWVKAAVERKGANIEYARMCVQDRERWRRAPRTKHTWAYLNPIDFEVSCVEDRSSYDEFQPGNSVQLLLDSLPGAHNSD